MKAYESVLITVAICLATVAVSAILATRSVQEACTRTGGSPVGMQCLKRGDKP